MVLIIRGSLGFSLLPTPSFLFLQSLLQYARWMWMRQSLSPWHHHVPLLPPSQAAVVGQVGDEEQNTPRFWFMDHRWPQICSSYHWSFFWHPKNVPVQKEVSISEMWKLSSVVIIPFIIVDSIIKGSGGQGILDKHFLTIPPGTLTSLGSFYLKHEPQTFVPSPLAI